MCSKGVEWSSTRSANTPPADDIRTIDWNVTARTGHPYVKRFVEERELTVMFVVDLSASGSFGTREKLKNEVAAELCALLAFSAIKNNDKVGLIVFTDHIELYIPPKKGVSHVLRVIRDLLNFRTAPFAYRCYRGPRFSRPCDTPPRGCLPCVGLPGVGL